MESRMKNTPGDFKDSKRISFGPFPRYWEPLLEHLAGSGSATLSWEPIDPHAKKLQYHWVVQNNGGATGAVQFPSRELERIFQTNLTSVVSNLAGSLT